MNSLTALRAAKTSELVAYYNANSGKTPITKFSDRATAEKRCVDLFETLAAATPPVAEAPAVTEVDVIVANPETAPAASGKNAVSPVRAAAIAKSWTDPDTAERRSARNSVSVDGIVYRSTKAAFIALGLPIAKHVAFRLTLKERGEATFGKYDFVLVNEL